MSIIKNGKNIIGMYKGDIPILKIFKHNNLVYQLSSTGGTETQYDITSTFNVTSTTSQTKLCHSSAISYFTEMYIDGVKIDVASGYTFNTTGEHTVQYKLADKTTIGDNAFFGCFKLKSVVIENSVETLSYRSFFNCNELTSVTIGSGVKTIGNEVFWNCLSLKSIDIPSSVETIGSSALGSCTSLTSVTIPSSVTSIGNEAFINSLIHTDNFINNSSATGYPWGAIIYDKVQDDGLYINGTTVVKCKENATNVTIPESITDIGDGAFFNCSSLNEITCLPTTAPTLNGTVFMGLPENGTLTYPCESDYSAWLSELRWKDTCNQGGQEKWVTLTKDTSRSIKMQTFRIDTSYPEFEDGNRFITFSTEPDYPGENADLTSFSICINEDTIYDNHSRKYIREQKHIEGNVYEYTFSVPVYFAGGEINAPLSQVQYKTTSEETPGQEGWVTLTQDTDRSIQMQTFRIDTSPTSEMPSGYYFITFSTSPNYVGENADITYFSICINEDRIYDNGSRKRITEQKNIEGDVYEYTFSVPVYFAGGERNAPLSKVQYKTTGGDNPGEVVSPYDITAKFDADIKPFSTQLCFSAYTSAFTEMYVDDMPISPTSEYTFSSTGEHTVGYMLKDKTTLASNPILGHFKGCSRMTEIKFKDELTTISGTTFSGCTRLQKVTFGSGLTSVGTSSNFLAFSIFTGCTNLREITCLAQIAPRLLTKSIQGVENNRGVLYVPQGSDYSTWKAILKSWTIQFIT